MSDSKESKPGADETQPGEISESAAPETAEEISAEKDATPQDEAETTRDGPEEIHGDNTKEVGEQQLSGERTEVSVEVPANHDPSESAAPEEISAEKDATPQDEAETTRDGPEEIHGDNTKEVGEQQLSGEGTEVSVEVPANNDPGQAEEQAREIEESGAETSANVAQERDVNGDAGSTTEVTDEARVSEREVGDSDEKALSAEPKNDAQVDGGERELVEGKQKGLQDAEGGGIPQPSAGIEVDETALMQEENLLQPEAPPPPSLAEISAVETATPRDIHVIFREEEQTQPLSLNWTFGFNRHIGSLDLSDTVRNLVMYAASHVAVLLDFENNVQKLLLGHANAITCLDCSADKRWLVTADKGENSSVIIWDSYTGIPVQSIFNIPGDKGTVAVAMSRGAKYLVTISATKVQTVSVWNWTMTSDEPICSVELPSTFGVQTHVDFCPGDNVQFTTNSDSRVVFYSWASGKLEFHAPFLTDDVFNRVVGLYCQTIFQADSKQALTGTSQGNIVVWVPERLNGKNAIQKRALKLVRLQDRAITTLTQTNGYIVTGDVTGAIKFYDSGLNLVSWYNKGIEIGPITSISFKYDPDFNTEILAESKMFPDDATITANPFIVRDFALSTRHAEIFNVHADGSIIDQILCEHDAAVHAIAASSTKPWLCIGSYAGLLKIWNYKTKQCVVTRVFEKGNNIQCVTFDSTGLQIAIGMTNGSVHILDSISLNDVIEKPFRYARDAVTHIAFSHNSKYLATADADIATTVFKYNIEDGWKYLGRYRAHYKPIKDLSFGIALDSNLPRLLTLGEDRTLVEYDLQNSSKDDLRILSMDRTEQSAIPSCLAWYPDVTKESFLVTANDQYKYKLYNTTTKMCRKTLLAPTYGSSIRKLLPLPPDKSDSKTRLLAYVTKYKVGLQILPLDGNPHKSIALVGHPSGVSHLACSHDGKYLFTAGGKDSCVHMWSISLKALEAATALGGEGLLPFYGLLEGGSQGELFAELENYFYFAQLRSQGLDTTESREVSTVIPLDQIPFVMRALGFYPSEQEIEDMINEVKFSEYVETGQYVTEINLGDFIKLYVNHRPAFGLSPDEIQKAFNTLGSVSSSGESHITNSELYNILQRKGEHLTEQELSQYLATLLGISSEGGSTDLDRGFEEESAREILDSILPNQITASMFSEEILGLPVYDSQE